MGRTTEGVQGWRKRESHGNRSRQEAGQKDGVGEKQERQRKRDGKERETGRERERQIVMLLLILMKCFSIKFP